MTTIPEEITNLEDIIDSRDVIARIEWLEGQAPDPDVCADCDESRAAHADTAIDHPFLPPEWEDEEERDELAALKDLAEEAEGYAADWIHGEALIRRSYFETYAQELAEDCGMIDPSASWPMRHLDWEAAARELEQDYTTVDFDGEEYLIR